MTKQKLLEELEEVKMIAALRLERLRKKRERLSRKVPVPVDMLDSLLAAIENSNHVDVKNIAATIREEAENHHPVRWKTGRLGHNY